MTTALRHPILTLRVVRIFADGVRFQHFQFATPLVFDFLLIESFLRLRDLIIINSNPESTNK